MTASTPALIQHRPIHAWFGWLFASSFAAAAQGFFGFAVAVGVFLLALLGSTVTTGMAWKHRHHIDTQKSTADAVAGMGLLPLLWGVFGGQLIPGLVGMLFFLQLGLSVQFVHQRQVSFIPLVSFVALMVGAAFAKGSSFVLFMLLFAVFACLYLAAVYVDKQQMPLPSSSSAEHPSSVHWFRKLGVIVALCLLSLTVYLVMPRFPAGNIGSGGSKGLAHYTDNRTFEEKLLNEGADLSKQFADLSSDTADGDLSSQGSSGLPKLKVDRLLGDEGQVQPGGQCYDNKKLLGDEVFAYVKSPRPVYLQTQTRTYFDGRSWYALQNAYAQVPHKRGWFRLYEAEPNAQLEVAVVQDIDAGVMVPANAVQLAMPAKMIGRDVYDGISIGKTLRADTLYQIKLHDTHHQGRLVDAFQTAPNKRDKQLPDQLDPRIKQLAQRLTQGALTDWDKALLLEQYMRSNHRYTLSTVSNQNNVPLVDFLFHSKAGHCEYFATSLAVMLRSLGIPARMVMGYAAQELNPVTGYYELKGSHGHAWVQAHLDGHWVLLEGTGAYSVPEEKPTTSATHEQIKTYLDALKEEQKRLQEAGQEQPLTFKQIMVAVWSSIIQAFQLIWAWVKWLLPVLAGIGVVLAALWWFAHWLYARHKNRIDNWRDARKVRKHRAKNNLDDVAFYMNMLQRRLARQGIIRQPGMTIERFAQALTQSSVGINQADLEQLQTLVNRYYYLGEPYERTDVAWFVSLYQQVAMNEDAA